MATARLAGNLKIELAAAEPNVVDPVAMAFDADGRMYVVEMRDYPIEPRTVSKPLGQVRLLEDFNQDGYYEKATVFADGLQYPTSVLPWRGGVGLPAAALIRWPQERADSVRICDRSVPQAGISSKKSVSTVPANSYNQFA